MRGRRAPGVGAAPRVVLGRMGLVGRIAVGREHRMLLLTAAALALGIVTLSGISGLGGTGALRRRLRHSVRPNAVGNPATVVRVNRSPLTTTSSGGAGSVTGITEAGLFMRLSS